MRTCAACFWCPPRTHNVETKTGECWNRPPVVIGVPNPADPHDLVVHSVRAPVRLDEFCHFFQHHKERP